MSRLFDFDGAHLDLGFINLREAASVTEQTLNAAIEAFWTVYEPYADPDFREGFARDPDARFWEMYLGCSLLEAGHRLLPTAERRREGGQPDLCVIENDRRIWIEAITPDEGQGADRIVRPVPINMGGQITAAPVREVQLRVTSAFWTKTQVIRRYLAQGVIAPEDGRVIAISTSRFGGYATENPWPVIMTSLFPIGDAYLTIDRETGEIVDQGFHTSEAIARTAGDIPRTAFLDPAFSDVSGVIGSRVGIGNLSRAVRPLALAHNPLATVPLRAGWGPWDREYVAIETDDAWRISDIRESSNSPPPSQPNAPEAVPPFSEA